MRTTIRLPEALLRKAKKRAAERGETLTALIEEGLKAVLAESRPAPRARVTVPISSVSGRLMPGVDLNNSADLEDLMDGL